MSIIVSNGPGRRSDPLREDAGDGLILDCAIRINRRQIHAKKAVYSSMQVASSLYTTSIHSQISDLIRWKRVPICGPQGGPQWVSG